MELNEAIRFLELMNQQNVEYLIIGGAAVNVHGYARATGDLDIWYKPTKNNFEKILKAIELFGFDITPLKNLTGNSESSFVRLPLDNFYVELIAKIDGKLLFDETYQNAMQFNVGDITVPVIGYNDLIQNKLLSRRAKDLEDIAQLERRKNREKE